MLKSLLSDTITSSQFLSRLPIRPSSSFQLPNFSKTAYAFPIAGLIIAFPSALIFLISLLLGVSPLISALLAISSMVIITGALHEDGLADIADGFFGGNTVEQVLKIMRDSHIGVYGTLALIFSIGLRTFMFASIAQTSGPWKTAIIFLCVASLSRAAILYPWSHLQPARSSTDSKRDMAGKETSGLSARYGTPSKKSYYKSAILSLPAIAALFWSTGLWPVICGLVSLKIATLAITQLSRQKINGQTGDTLGATQQFSEIGLLLGLIIAM